MAADVIAVSRLDPANSSLCSSCRAKAQAAFIYGHIRTQLGRPEEQLSLVWTSAAVKGSITGDACRQQGMYSRLEFIAPPLLLWMAADAVRVSFEAAAPRQVADDSFRGDGHATEFLLPYDCAVGLAIDTALR